MVIYSYMQRHYNNRSRIQRLLLQFTLAFCNITEYTKMEWTNQNELIKYRLWFGHDLFPIFEQNDSSFKQESKF